MNRKRPCKVCGAESCYYNNSSGLCKSCWHKKQKEDYIANWLLTGVVIRYTPGRWIREYILEQQNEKCAICQMPMVWNRKPIVFILDHRNGDPTNHRRENLRMICPNCDSQLPTYKSKNRGRGLKYYRDAGNLRYARHNKRKVGRADECVSLEKRKV